MAIELAVFLLGELVPVVGGDAVEGSFCTELRDIQAKGLVNFRVGGAGGAACWTGAVAVFKVGGRLGLVLVGVASGFEGDQGKAGKELAKLLRDSFFLGSLGGTAGGCSSSRSLLVSILPSTVYPHSKLLTFWFGYSFGYCFVVKIDII